MLESFGEIEGISPVKKIIIKESTMRHRKTHIQVNNKTIIAKYYKAQNLKIRRLVKTGFNCAHYVY